MRRLQGVLLFACLAGLAGDRRAAVAQQPGGKAPTYWANHKIDIPVNLDAVKKFHADRNLPEPRDLQLFVARNGGEFVPSRKVAFTNLDKTGEGKSGFWFTADKDGAYEFSVQFLYADGTANPPTDKLAPQQRIVIDTVPPEVKARGFGNTVEWSATDDNIDPASVKLQCKRPSWSEWQTIPDRAMKATDRYAWQLRPTDALEVRVLARDKAGNEGVSSLVRLPADGAGVNPRPAPPGGGGGEWPPRGPEGVVPRPRVQYVKTMAFEVDYTIERMGRSGVKAAHLWVQKGQGDWAPAGSKDVDLTPNGKEQKLSMPYTADREGLYGFCIIPESGAGIKADPPRKDDPAQVLVVVDVERPQVKITDVSVRPGGGRGPIVDVSWEAADQNPMPNGINLEYADAKSPGVWKEIKYRTSNLPNVGTPTSGTGRYEWEIPDTELWKFHVRIRSTDLAGNTGEHVWDKLVMVDLEKPAAAIGGVRGSGTPPPVEQPKTTNPPKKPDTPLPAPGGTGTPPKTPADMPPTPGLPGGGVSSPPPAPKGSGT